MTYDIRPNAVRGVVNEVQQALNGKFFNDGEVMMGLAEVIGRAIVRVAATPVEGAQAATVVTDHLQNTLHVGFSDKGFNMGDRG